MTNRAGDDLERPARRSAGGRPTRAAAELRDERLIETAATLFMERGFDGVSVDAVAEAAGVSKPTVYARYRDKADLFRAVLQRRIRLWLEPLSAAAEAQARAAGPRDIETTLHDLSRELLSFSSAPGAGALQRILAAQSQNFPELAKLAYEEGFLRGIRAVASIFERFVASGQIKTEDPEIAAELFLSLIFGRSQRFAVYGVTTSPEEQERRRKLAVELFLNGVKPHGDAPCAERMVISSGAVD
jgi:TetR/AcrR family transcriptional regulator, mexJK operon transcriptional repressor